MNVLYAENQMYVSTIIKNLKKIRVEVFAMSIDLKKVMCDEPHCINTATYELEWQDGDGFSSVKVCDEHFPRNPDVVQSFCCIMKVK
jgi:hypothetical protein